MITVDITSPGGAFTPAAPANTQELTTTFSISSGTATLTCNGASPFVSGDTGKTFMIDGPGTTDINGSWLVGTLTYVSANQVTLSVNATQTITSQSCYMAWGNDDAAAFRACNTWAQAQSDEITVTLGSKKYIFASTDPVTLRGGAVGYNINLGITFQGNGIANTKWICSNVHRSFPMPQTIFYLKSGTGVYPDYTTEPYTARLDTVAAGSSTVQCKDIADALLFTNDTYALLTCADLQGGGTPPNPYLYEYVYLTDVNTTTGVITFQSPVANTYSDTLPEDTLNLVQEPDQAGPATLYALDPAWNSDVTYEGFEFYNPWGQTATKGLRTIFRDIQDLGPWGIFPTGSKEVQFINCNLPYTMEVDKITEHVIFDNTTAGELLFQSSVNRVEIINGSTVDSLNGTSRLIEVHNSTIDDIGIGATGFGRTESFITSGSTYTGGLTYSGINDLGDNAGGSTILDDGYTMSSSGVIRMAYAGRPYFGLRWATPGARVYLYGREIGGSLRPVQWGPMMTVLSVTRDTDYIYVQTDWPYTSGFPTWVQGIRTVPSTYINFAADTVTSTENVQVLVDATAAGFHKPGSYRLKEFNGSNCGTDIGTNQTSIQDLGGRLISFSINVTTPYTGAQSTLTWSTGLVTLTDPFTFQTWTPVINLKAAGNRVIAPAGVTGTQTGDSSLSLPNASMWLARPLIGWGTGSKDIRTEYAGNPSLGPVFTVEVKLNQTTDLAPSKLTLGRRK